MANRSTTKNSIILVPFPFDDFSTTKVRPALCLTTEIGTFNHIVIAFIPSKIPENPIESDLVIKKHSKDWEGTGLVTDSVIRLHKMVTIPKSLIKRKLGRVNILVGDEIRKKIIRLFDDK